MTHVHNLVPLPSAEPNSQFSAIAQSLRDKGYLVLPDALPAAVLDCLEAALANTRAQHFAPAAVGRGRARDRNTFVRRDRIAWMDPESQDLQPWFQWIDALKQYLNRQLLLGLFSFESHFAYYRPGDFYKTHLDAFRGAGNRVLSLVTYLNKGWEPDQGGELVIYAAQGDGEVVRVTPALGTLVLFLSEEFPHEVLATDRERFSVAGWFRVNNSRTARVDPPA